ncbi:MAG: hypothetical protein ACR2IK_05505 [Chloroflexota bacterium]
MDLDRLQAQAQHKQDAHLLEAAHERLLRWLDPAAVRPAPAHNKRALSVLALLVGIVAVFGSTGLPVSLW